MMKQTTPNKERIGGKTFYIFPFPAFVAANLSGEVTRLIVPVLSSFLPLANELWASGKEKKEGQKLEGETKADPAEKGIMDRDIDLSMAGTVIGDAFSRLSGDQIEHLLRKLLVEYKNITYEDEDGNREKLTEDLVNELFCGDAQEMFILAYHVIRCNYASFFGKAGNLFGALPKTVMAKAGALMSAGMAI